MGLGLVMLGVSMPLLVLPSTLTGVGAALCFMGVSCALAVTGALPQVPLAPDVSPIASHPAARRGSGTYGRCQWRCERVAGRRVLHVQHSVRRHFPRDVLNAARHAVHLQVRAR